MFGKHTFLDFFAILANVGPPAKHKFIGDNPQSEIVHRKVMVFATHDFRSHIAWGPTCIVCVTLLKLTRNSKIGYSEIPLGIQHQVLRLDVSMYDLILVDILQTDEYIGHKKLGLLLIEKPLIAQMVAKVSTIQVIHDQV